MNYNKYKAKKEPKILKKSKKTYNEINLYNYDCCNEMKEFMKRYDEFTPPIGTDYHRSGLHLFFCPFCKNLNGGFITNNKFDFLMKVLKEVKLIIEEKGKDLKIKYLDQSYVVGELTKRLDLDEDKIVKSINQLINDGFLSRNSEDKIFTLDFWYTRAWFYFPNSKFRELYMTCFD